VTGTASVTIDAASLSAWQTLDIGAGGYLTGMDIAPDDTMVVRTDTYGAYIWTGTQWQQLVTSTSLPAGDAAPYDGQGVYEIRIAADSTTMYMEFGGNVYRSDNKGVSWTQTSFAHVVENPDDAYRMDGQKMAIDPNNPNVVYVGTPQNGMFVTTDGGVDWQNVNSVPVSTKDNNNIFPGITGIAFDPTSGLIGGKTKTVYAASFGNGVYQSTDAGNSWVKLVGGPADVEYAVVSVTGTYYALADGNNELWSYANGTWTELLSGHIFSIAVDPFNPEKIVAVGNNARSDISLDGGATWSGWINGQLSASDIPWLNTTAPYLAPSGIVFDQLIPNKLWASGQAGFWYANVPQNSAPIVWHSQSVGIEQLVANEIIVPPGGKPVLASWDRAFFYVSDPDAYPSTFGPVNSPTIVAGWSLDYASSNPNFVVGIAEWHGLEESGYSLDGGQTWTIFPTFPTFGGQPQGGSIAASSPTDILWAPDRGLQPYYTLNGGLSWNPVSLPGVTDWKTFDPYADQRTVTADRVQPNTFYLYYAGHGFYKSVDGSVTWTLVSQPSFTPTWDTQDTDLQSVPGEAGNLFFTHGPQPGALNQPLNEGFYQSTDGGVTWSAIPNVLEVETFGFGAPEDLGGYPAIYIVGWVNNVYGIWQSNDEAKSWTQIGVSPLDSFDTIKTISGDPDQYDQVYIGFNGSGYAYLPGAVLDPPTATVTGAITLTPTRWLEFNASNLPLLVNTPQNSSIVTYRFTDVSSDPASADLWYSLLGSNNGFVTQGGTVDVPASQLTNLWISGGTTKGVDSLQVQVFDGSSWSAPVNITVNTDSPPVVSAATTSFANNEVVALSSLFTATDPDGDSITQYLVSQISSGGSYLEFNGTRQPANTVFTINASDLSQWYVVTSPVNHASDQFQVSASDGIATSAPTTIAISAGNTPSVVTVTGGLTVTPNGWLEVTSLPISVTDADNDPIVDYRFTDLGSSGTYLWFNNNIASGTSVMVPAAQLSNLWIHGAASNSTDTLQVEVFDGYQWSAPQDISIVTHNLNHPPVVSAPTTTFGLDQTVAASTMFTVSDADGDTITDYKITDATVGGASLWLDGAQLAETTPIEVSAALWPDLQIVTSSVNRTMSSFTVQAYDGYDWSAPTSVTIESMTPDNPSVVTVTGGLTVTPKGWLEVTSLPISVTDADHDPIVSYRFTDLGSSGTYLWFNNNIASGTSVVVPAAQLANLWIHGAATTGTDTLQVEVFDGYQWSAPQDISIAIRNANHPPVVSAATTTFGLGQSVAASSIFTSSDADGDTITQYEITHTGGGSSLQLNGQSLNTVTIAAADLSHLTILTSSVNRSTDTFTVQAFDGYNWSAAASITVTSMLPDHPSVVTVTGDLMVQPDGWLNVTSLPITVTDADNDPIVDYRFTEAGSDGTYLWFNNNIGLDTSVVVPAAQLSNLWIHGAATTGTDTLQVEVFDGYQWSTPQDITVWIHGAEHAPIVSAATTSLDYNQTVSLSSIFSVSDPDGDAITQYQVTETGGGSQLEHLQNGVWVVQAENTTFTIDAADLSQWQVVTSSVTHDVSNFQIAASDGIEWSSPTSIGVVSGDTPSVETVTGALQLMPTQWLNFNTSSALPLSVTDADQDPIVTYRFTDVGTDPTSAHLWFNNTIVQGGTVDVPADQLSNLWIQGGITGGIDTLRVQVYDGFAWSAPQDVAVITSLTPVNPNPGAHIVSGTTGTNDVLTGTAASDTFVFAPNFGNDTVVNYTPGQDVIAIDHTMTANLAVALLTATEVNGNTTLHLDANDSITFNGVSKSALHLTDFHIV